MFRFTHKISFFWAVLFVILTLYSGAIAQQNIDLDLSFNDPGLLRGGEKFVSVATIKNLGPQSASKVILLLDDGGRNLNIISATPSQGNCEIEHDKWMIRCALGSIPAGETVIISVEARVKDFGGSLTPSTVETLPVTMGNNVEDGKIESPAKEPVKEVMEVLLLGSVRAFESETFPENNDSSFKVFAHPSLNAGPAINVSKPGLHEKIKKRKNKPVDVQIEFAASDPDGRVVKIAVADASLQKFFTKENVFRKVAKSDGTYTYFIGEKEYTKKELNEYYAALNEKNTTRIPPTDNGIYTFLWKGLQLGPNVLAIIATDNGGRETIEMIRIDVFE